MPERSQTQHSHASFGEDDLPTKPDPRPIPYRGLSAMDARGNEPEEEDEDEDADEDEFDEFDEFDDAVAIRTTRAGALATSAWDRGQGSSSAVDLALLHDDTLADTERHPPLDELDAPTDVDVPALEEPEDRG